MLGQNGGGDEALQAAAKESVDQIVEVCNVSREDALRVLERCDFDVQIAIDRFLTGEEEWYEVPKKRKPADRKQASAPRGSARTAGGGLPGGSSSGTATTNGGASVPGGVVSGSGSKDSFRNQNSAVSSRGNAGGGGDRGTGGGSARGRRQRGTGAGRGEKEFGSSSRRPHGGEPTWASSATTGNEKLPEWALPSNAVANNILTNSTDAYNSGWVSGGTVDGGWDPSKRMPKSESSTWTTAENAEVRKESSPAFSPGGTGAKNMMRGEDGTMPSSTTTNTIPTATISSGTEASSQVSAGTTGGLMSTATATAAKTDGLKPKLNFAAVVAAGTIHDKKALPMKEMAPTLAATPTARPAIPPVEMVSTRGVETSDHGLHLTSAPQEVEQGEENVLLTAWAPASADEAETAGTSSIASGGAPPATEGSNVGATKKERGVREPVLSDFGVNQLGLQFGSFALDGQTNGSVRGAGGGNGEWNAEPKETVPASMSPSVGGGGRNFDGLDPLQGGTSGAPPTVIAGPPTESTQQLGANAQNLDASRAPSTAANMFAQSSAYAMQHVGHPHQQYPMVPIPYPQYEDQQGGARSGMQSGQMQGYYNPSLVGMVPPTTYRDAKSTGTASAGADATTGVSGVNSGGKAALGRGQSGGAPTPGVERGAVGGVPNALNNATLEQLNSYMISPGFPPYASLYAFNPYGGPAMGPPQPPYPQYTHASTGGNRGASRSGLDGFDDGGYAPGAAETATADSHMYGHVAYLGVPMMPDIHHQQQQQQQHPQHQHQQQPQPQSGMDRGHGSEGYKLSSAGGGPRAGGPPSTLGYSADFANPQQPTAWINDGGVASGAVSTSRPDPNRDTSSAAAQGGQPAPPSSVATHGNASQTSGSLQNPQVSHQVQQGRPQQQPPLPPQAQSNAAGYYAAGPSAGHYPFYPTYY